MKISACGVSVKASTEEVSCTRPAHNIHHALCTRTRLELLANVVYTDVTSLACIFIELFIHTDIPAHRHTDTHTRSHTLTHAYAGECHTVLTHPRHALKRLKPKQEVYTLQQLLVEDPRLAPEVTDYFF